MFQGRKFFLLLTMTINGHVHIKKVVVSVQLAKLKPHKEQRQWAQAQQSTAEPYAIVVVVEFTKLTTSNIRRPR